MKISHIHNVIKERWVNNGWNWTKNDIDVARNDILDLLDYIKELESLIDKKVNEITVDDLRDEIDTLESSLLVVLSRDSEGNRFSPLSDMDVGVYHDGEFVSNDDIEDDISFPCDGRPALTLYPK